MIRTPAALLFVTAVACAHTTPPVAKAPEPAPVLASEMVDHSGDSPETAIAVPADAPNGGADFENQWIFEMYGQFHRHASGTGTLEGRRYNVVKIELPSGEKKTVYFDITELWAKSLQQQP
jgi:hypothetical protein